MLGYRVVKNFENKLNRLDTIPDRDRTDRQLSTKIPRLYISQAKHTSKIGYTEMTLD